MEHPLKSIEMRIALVISLVVHLFIGLICYFLHTEITLPSVEFAEMSFLASTDQDLPMTVENPVEDMNPLAEQLASPLSETSSPLTDPVQLPKLRDSQKDDDELIKRDYGKLDAGEPVNKIEIASDQYDRNVTLPETPAPGEKKVLVLPGQSNGQDRPVPLQQHNADMPAQNQPYTIEGEATERRILYKEIPKYPAGLQKEAIVKIRITVLPDGRMGPMIPMQKGDPTLEEVTIKALRQWRFDPLPAGVAQKNVQGIITFRYELR